jgi:hypothetical protein
VPPKLFNIYSGSAGGAATAGQILGSGEAGTQGFFTADYAIEGKGGRSVLGGARFTNVAANVAGSQNGNAGSIGAGGNGAISIVSAAAANGGAGGNGIIIIDCYI